MGLLTNTFGSRTYPVSYSYDAQGRMKTMKTYKNFAANSGVATTTWNYDAYRGWLTNKVYDDSHGPSYTYTPAGRLLARIWARGVGTTNGYNVAGDLLSVSYSDATLGYIDRRGRKSGILNGPTTISLNYNDAGQLLAENYSGGPLSGTGITNVYDQFLRRTNLSSVGLTNSYLYDSASRLHSVSEGTNSATYAYLANSPLVSQISFTNGSVQRMVTTKAYDLLNRLTNITSVPSASSAVSFAYQYNSANQRTRRADADSSYWTYSYDSLGQVISGKRYWSDNSPVAGQQFEYSFDDIGDRASTRSGGDQYNGSYLRSANYGNNSLNQITSRDVPGYLDIFGSAKTNATVSLWTPDGYWAQTEAG